MFKRKVKTSTTFSDFVRSASSRDKKKIYSKALKEATAAQQAIIDSARTAKASA
jgi:hypothetical protein